MNKNGDVLLAQPNSISIGSRRRFEKKILDYGITLNKFFHQRKT